MFSSLSDDLKDITIPENKPPLGEAAFVNVSVMCESPLPSTSALAAAGKRSDSLDLGDQEGTCSSFQLFFWGGVDNSTRSLGGRYIASRTGDTKRVGSKQ